ncbi:unnamed protein product [Didymodactylos carnosus]|uniref:Protein kinase domain-containing protein n=1 Tax=Didymodactylos carnosus TaxID=1234261 RepID=A0A814D8F0_9BILA|nr:unnamed protein product [Didymodactylos carnosus]CAF3727431.1 unnamed protein product [Didymodactylos carnosus]
MRTSLRNLPFDSQTALAFMVMELGGDNLEEHCKKLNEIVNERTRSKERHHARKSLRGEYIPDKNRKEIWKQLVSILNTLRKYNIVHLDLKPMNLVFFGPYMKLVDLGIAKKTNTICHGRAGTEGYTAPEVFFAPPGTSLVTNFKADIWSAGAILYYMTYGLPPRSPPAAPYAPPPGLTPTRDQGVIDILRHCLHRDSNMRPDPVWLRNHPYTHSQAN